MEKNRDKDKDIEGTIRQALKFGVLLSAGVILAGFVLYIVTGISGYPNDGYPTNLVQIFKGAVALKSYAIILVGLFILILTPVFQVGMSVITFWKKRDYTYMKISGLVFAILLISFLLGKVE